MWLQIRKVYEEVKSSKTEKYFIGKFYSKFWNKISATHMYITKVIEIFFQSVWVLNFMRKIKFISSTKKCLIKQAEINYLAFKEMWKFPSICCTFINQIQNLNIKNIVWDILFYQVNSWMIENDKGSMQLHTFSVQLLRIKFRLGLSNLNSCFFKFRYSLKINLSSMMYVLLILI